jgi:hypothetical protein
MKGIIYYDCFNNSINDESRESLVDTTLSILKLLLPGSAFHCPYYIKKLSHEKHVAFYENKKKKKNFL